MWFMWNTVVYGLLLHSSCGEGPEHAKNGVPMPLGEVVGDVVHELRRRRAPGITTKWLTRGNEISSGVHLVRTFNLPQGSIRVVALKEKHGHTPAVTRARTPNGRFPTPGSSYGTGSMMPDEV